MVSQDICRTCLFTGRPLFSLFDEAKPRLSASGTATVVDLLKVMDEILISRNDGFPDQICSLCLDEIERSYAFKLKCKSSEAKLIKMKDAKIELKRLNEYDKDETDLIFIKNELPDDEVDDSNFADESFFEAGLDMDVTMIENMEKDEFNPGMPSSQICVKPEIFMENSMDSEDLAVAKQMEKIAARRAKRRQRYYEKTHKEPKPFDVDSEFQCRACPNVYGKIEMLRKHLVDSHTQGTMCFVCEKDYQFEDMWKHCLNHLPTKHKCSECGKGFIKRGYLKAHVKYTHSNFHREIFPCKFCSKTFKTRSGISYHRQVAHSVEKAYKCEICTKSFSHVKLLKIHMLGVHTDHPPFKCKFCSFGFKSRQTMINHVRNYHNNKHENIPQRNSYKCILCPKEFTEKRNLNIHVLNIHTNSRPYKCPHCPFAFKFQATMITHINSNHSHKNQVDLKLSNKCEICAKVFRSKRSFLVHIATKHSTERPYQCTFCSYTFKIESNLAAHINTIHKDRLGQIEFKCSECDSLFYSEEHLIEHKTLEHNGQYEENGHDNFNSTDYILKTMFE